MPKKSKNKKKKNGAKPTTNGDVLKTTKLENVEPDMEGEAEGELLESPATVWVTSVKAASIADKPDF